MEKYSYEDRLILCFKPEINKRKWNKRTQKKTAKVDRPNRIASSNQI